MTDFIGFSNDSISGFSTGAVDLELVVIGEMEATLRGSPSEAITIWQMGFTKTTNSAIESVLTSVENFETGKEFSQTIKRSCDKLWCLDFVVTCPGILACPQDPDKCNMRCPYPIGTKDGDGNYVSPTYSKDLAKALEKGSVAGLRASNYDTEVDYHGDLIIDGKESDWCHYTNNLGHAMIDRASFVAGGVVLGHTYGETMWANSLWNYNSEQSSDERLFRYANRLDLIFASMKGDTIYVDSGFFFTHAPETSFPYGALHIGCCEVMFKVRPLSQLIIVSRPNVKVIKSKDGQEINSTAFKVQLDSMCVHLSDQERAFNQDYTGFLFTKNCKLMTWNFTVSQPFLSIPLVDLKSYTTAIGFYVRRCENFEAGELFNTNGVLGESPILGFELKFDGQPRFTQRPFSWASRSVPFHFTKRTPRHHIGMIPFSPEPLGYEFKSGSNLSKVNDVILNLFLDPCLIGERIIVSVIKYGCSFTTYSNGQVYPTFNL